MRSCGCELTRRLGTRRGMAHRHRGRCDVTHVHTRLGRLCIGPLPFLPHKCRFGRRHGSCSGTPQARDGVGRNLRFTHSSGERSGIDQVRGSVPCSAKRQEDFSL
jgi:hypothetical protein